MTGLDLQILGPALIAGLLVLATHVPLGMILLERNSVFIDFAPALAAATGVAFARMMWGDTDIWVIQASAIGAALLCAALLVWTDRRYDIKQEAVIGAVYVAMAAVLLILLPHDPSGAEFLKRLLTGQILSVGPLQLIIVGLVYAVALVIWLYRDLGRESVLFYLVFAVVIAISVQIVGILLVFASLLVPALATHAAPSRRRHLIAFNVGVVGYLTGLVVSVLFIIPTGATIVCALVLAALVARLLVRRGPGNAANDDDKSAKAAKPAILSRIAE